jgi:hypothetical protein
LRAFLRICVFLYKKAKMNKKLLISTCLTIFIFLSLHTLYAADAPEKFPRELRDMGYKIENLISYRKTSRVEYFTFPDSRTEAKGATITFVLEDGEVISSFNGAIKVNVQEQPLKHKKNDETKWLFEDTREDVEGKIKRDQ